MQPTHNKTKHFSAKRPIQELTTRTSGQRLGSEAEHDSFLWFTTAASLVPGPTPLTFMFLDESAKGGNKHKKNPLQLNIVISIF